MRGVSPAKQQNAQKLYRKGLQLQQSGALAEAAKAYEKARAILPDHFAILTNLGVCLGLLGRHRKALPMLRRANALKPNEPTILGALGATLVQLGEADEAAPLLEAALRRAPGDRQSQMFYALALERQGHDGLALGAMERAARLGVSGAEEPAALRELARMYGAARMREKEALAGERAFALDPTWLEPNLRAYFAYQQLFDWDALARLDGGDDGSAGDVLARCRADTTPEGEPRAYLGDPFALLGRAEDPALERKAGARRAAWLSRVHGLDAPFATKPRARQPGEPLKVGYLSGDLRDHAVMHVLAGVFRAHDPSRVAIHAYAHGDKTDDPYRRLVEERAQVFRDLDSLSAAEAAAAIRQDELDLLVDLNGYTAGSRIEILAWRPAPVQAAFLGYPASTGAPFIDYAIVDAHVAPPERAEDFSEILAYHPVCYLPVDPGQEIAAEPSRRADWGLPDDAPVFCSFNQAFKIEPVRFATWMTLLRETPGSALWIGAQPEIVQERMRAQAAKQDVAPERIVFAERVEKARHFERMRHATAALDTRVYNGHTTTFDALLSDVPVVATEGGHFAGRVAGSILRAAGLEDLIAEDEAGCLAIAKALADDPGRRRDVVERIKAARAGAAVFDPARFARSLEDVFAAIIERGPAAGSASRDPISIA